MTISRTGPPQEEKKSSLRGLLSDAVNELNKLLLATRNPDEESKIRKLTRIYFALWEEVIKQELDRSTKAFKDAIEELKQSKEATEEAKKDIEKIATAINRAVAAAKAVDKVVKLGIDLLA